MTPLIPARHLRLALVALALSLTAHGALAQAAAAPLACRFGGELPPRWQARAQLFRAIPLEADAGGMARSSCPLLVRLLRREALHLRSAASVSEDFGDYLVDLIRTVGESQGPEALSALLAPEILDSGGVATTAVARMGRPALPLIWAAWQARAPGHRSSLLIAAQKTGLQLPSTALPRSLKDMAQDALQSRDASEWRGAVALLGVIADAGAMAQLEALAREATGAEPHPGATESVHAAREVARRRQEEARGIEWVKSRQSQTPGR